VVPLEVTHACIATKDVMERLRHRLGATYFWQLVEELLGFFADTYKHAFGFREGPPLHDPCAVLYAVASDLFMCRKMYGEVICGDGPCAGQTVCDIWGYNKRIPNVNVCKPISVSEFWRVMEEVLVRASAISPLNNVDISSY